MDLRELDQQLRAHTEFEEKHLSGIYKDYSSFPVEIDHHGQRCYSFTIRKEDIQDAIRDHKIMESYYHFGVFRQDRFEAVPLHWHHEWIEMVYVYSGVCCITTDSKNVQLNQGDFCLISSECSHSVNRLGENDIVLNFLITWDYLKGTYFDHITLKNSMTGYYVTEMWKTLLHEELIVFQKNVLSPRTSEYANAFLCDFYDPSLMCGSILDGLMEVLSSELINAFDRLQRITLSKSTGIYAILKYIEANYMDCTLKSMADYFNLHPNYLSSYIHNHSGKTFNELVQEQKMYHAELLLKSTGLPILEICHAVGYQNSSYFYKTFRSTYGCSPKDYREKFLK